MIPPVEALRWALGQLLDQFLGFRQWRGGDSCLLSPRWGRAGQRYSAVSFESSDGSLSCTAAQLAVLMVLLYETALEISCTARDMETQIYKQNARILSLGSCLGPEQSLNELDNGTRYSGSR